MGDELITVLDEGKGVEICGRVYDSLLSLLRGFRYAVRCFVADFTGSSHENQNVNLGLGLATRSSLWRI